MLFGRTIRAKEISTAVGELPKAGPDIGRNLTPSPRFFITIILPPAVQTIYLITVSLGWRFYDPRGGSLNSLSHIMFSLAGLPLPILAVAMLAILIRQVLAYWRAQANFAPWLVGYVVFLVVLDVLSLLGVIFGGIMIVFGVGP